MADHSPQMIELEKRLDMLRHEIARIEKGMQDDVTRLDSILTRIERRLDKLEA